MKPKVSIICTTYNHKNYIRQALDGFIMQQTNFPFEVLLYDDASTDGTTDIVREYAEKYPDIIKPIIQTENQFSRGVDVVRTFVQPKIRGQYVAVCDGDDYWTDLKKLQKQVDFLDKHPDYSICFHPVQCFYESGKTGHIWPSKHELCEVSFNGLLRQNFIPNCAVMYRWVRPKKWPDNIYPGDWFLHLLHAKQGGIKYLPDVMACYRKHKGGISFVGTDGDVAMHRKWGVQEMQFFMAVAQQIAPKTEEYHKYVCERAREIINAYAMNNDFDRAITVLQMCPDALNYADIDSKKWQKRFNRLLVASTVTIITLIITGVVLL